MLDPTGGLPQPDEFETHVQGAALRAIIKSVPHHLGHSVQSVIQGRSMDVKLFADNTDVARPVQIDLDGVPLGVVAFCCENESGRGKNL